MDPCAFSFGPGGLGMAADRPGDDSFDAAWAQIVAGYDQQVDGADRFDPGDDAADVVVRTPSGPGSSAPDSSAPDSSVYGGDVLDVDGHFVPAIPPPLPRPRGAVGLAWVAVICGPLLLMFAAAVQWRMPTLLTSACVLGFVGGMIFLIMHLDDHRRDVSDGWDDGAQI